MTIFDILFRQKGEYFYLDEAGNAYLGGNCINTPFEHTAMYIEEGLNLLPKEEYDRFVEIELSISDDKEVQRYISTRRPYYRMRGKPISEEQAFEIIRRTERFF